MASSALALALFAAGCGPDAAPPPLQARSVEPLPGQLVVDAARPAWFRFHCGGAHFLAGAGDPEDFLYRGVRQPDGTRHGDQIQIIRNLAAAGVNGIYIQAIRSHGGDGEDDHNPFVASDWRRGLNHAVLDQWAEWIAELDAAGVVTYFFFYDDGSSVWDTGDEVSVPERDFIEALVNRFEHVRRIVWVIAEEYQEAFSAARVSRLAAIVRSADEHGHPIGVHKLSGLDFAEFADDPNIDQFTMQLNRVSVPELHEGVVTAWRRARGRYNLNLAESRNYGTGAVARRKSWAVAMGGAYVMVLGMDGVSTPVGDLEDLGRLRRFMETSGFERLGPGDDLAAGAVDYVLADPGSAYIAYAADIGFGEAFRILGVPDGRYGFRYFKPESGLEERGITEARDGRGLELPLPGAWAGEVALALHRCPLDGPCTAEQPVTDCTAPARYRADDPAAQASTRPRPASRGATRPNRVPIVRDRRVTVAAGESADLSLSFEDPDGPGPYTFRIVTTPNHGRLVADGNDVTYRSSPGFHGEDRFTWQVHDGMTESEVAEVLIVVQAP